MRRLTLAQAEYIAHVLAQEMFTSKEPLPDFKTRFPGRLEACLEQPFSTFSGKYLYWRLTHRAAVLFYGVIKNHPFENGNKRMAVILLMVFMYINKRFIKMSPQSLYDLACEVANSDPKDRSKIISYLNHTFKNKLVVRDR